jgi:hypothetical protein
MTSKLYHQTIHIEEADNIAFCGHRIVSGELFQSLSIQPWLSDCPKCKEKAEKLLTKLRNIEPFPLDYVV